jgi:hypothetical protein
VLQNFVAGFRPAKLVTRAGEPVLDEEGNQQFVPRFIHTKRLLECRTRAEVHEVLGRSFDLLPVYTFSQTYPVYFVVFLSPDLTCIFCFIFR